MKYWNIIVIMFVFNLSIGIVNASGMFDTEVSQINKGVVEKEDVKQAAVEAGGLQGQDGLLGDLNYLVQQVRLTISGLGIFVSAFGQAVFVYPALHGLFCSYLACTGAPQTLISALAGITWLAYLVGLVQLITGRNIKNYQ